MTALDISIEEKCVLHSALLRQRQSTSRQRLLSECNLSEGVPDLDVVTRLARHEELELAAIDGLLEKLR